MIIECQEPGEALADAMRRYGDKGSQALVDSISSSVQFGFVMAPRRRRFPLVLGVVEATCFLFLQRDYCE